VAVRAFWRVHLWLRGHPGTARVLAALTLAALSFGTDVVFGWRQFATNGSFMMFTGVLLGLNMTIGRRR
jgi:hypothetical protein